MLSTPSHHVLCAEICAPSENVEVTVIPSLALEGISFAFPLTQESHCGPAGLLGLKGQKKAKEKLCGTISLRRQDCG